MQGARRVITFCLLIAVLPVLLLLLPLYLRNSVYADVTYAVAESDILEMVNGISSVFCQEHSLRMNSTFSAFQIKGPLQVSPSVRKHVHLKKSMYLPDDTLEYWGFYLPKGSTVELSVCSRYDGSRILVVKGEKNLRNCGLMKPTKWDGQLVEGQGKVYVKFESAPTGLSNEEKEGDALYEGEVTDNPSLSSNDTIFSVDITSTPLVPEANKPRLRKRRHEKSRLKHLQKINEARRKALEKSLFEPENEVRNRKKRLVRMSPRFKLDGGIAHGGNALNFTSDIGNDSSASSFENSLLTCYDGQILFAQGFDPSRNCTSPHYLETEKHMQATHEVLSDGYYYYIFYSDNDFVQNDIHAIFNIYKPTYEYHNYSHGCINQTECTFPINFMSDETVIVEVPTNDGIEHESHDYYLLTSSCHPRSAVYAIFPVAVLFLILICSFV